MDLQEPPPSADEVRRTRWNADHLIEALERVPFGTEVRVAVPDMFVPGFYDEQIVTAICHPRYQRWEERGTPRTYQAKVLMIETELAPGNYYRIGPNGETTVHHEPLSLSATDLLRQLKRLTTDRQDSSNHRLPMTVHAADDIDGTVRVELYIDGGELHVSNDLARLVIQAEIQPWGFGTEYYPPSPDRTKPKDPK